MGPVCICVCVCHRETNEDSVCMVYVFINQENIAN